MQACSKTATSLRAARASGPRGPNQGRQHHVDRGHPRCRFAQEATAHDQGYSRHNPPGPCPTFEPSGKKCPQRGTRAWPINLKHRVWFNSLPLQRFQELLILFSKSFSSFLHSTCSLSVLCMYLALDGIYHPLNAPLPRSATHGSSPYAKACGTHTGFSPGATLFSKKT